MFGIPWRRIVRGREVQGAAAPAVNVSKCRVEMRTAFSNMVANTGCSSPGELEMTLSTSEVAVCSSRDFAQLVQQPRVLEGDHGLRREVFDQFDLFIGKGTNHLTAQ